MVSIAIAVFPVWRSPIISSRCPRPIGIIASIDLTPVWSGVFTDSRSTTDGALRSNIYSSARPVRSNKTPFASSGAPSGLTTRPITSFPIRIERTRPDLLTRSPTLTAEASPSITVPIKFSSRLNATADTSPVCVSIERSSCESALRSPEIFAMPSPASTTEPTSSNRGSSLNPSISFFSFSIIS